MSSTRPFTRMCRCRTSWRACLRDVAKPMRYTRLSSRLSRATSSASPVTPGSLIARSNRLRNWRSERPYMRLTFCFSRNCFAYSDALRRRPVDWPCCPGAYARRSTAHFSVRQRVPLRNSFVPSRRHNLQTGPVYRDMLNPPFLGRAAPVVRNRRHIADRTDLQPGTGERLNGGLAPGAWTLHTHVHTLHTEVQRFPRRLLGRDGCGEGRGLFGALEAGLAGRTPRDRVALQIGDRDERVVERRGDMRDALGFDDLLGALRATCRTRWSRFGVRLGVGFCVGLRVWLRVWFCVGHVPLLFQHGLLLARDGAPRSLFCARVGVRALAAHRQILAMASAAIGPDVHQPFDVHRDFRPKRAFDLVVSFDHLAQPGDFGVPQVAHARVRTDARLRENLDRVAGTDAEDVRKRVLDLFVARQIHACDTSHASP